MNQAQKVLRVARALYLSSACAHRGTCHIASPKPKWLTSSLGASRRHHHQHHVGVVSIAHRDMIRHSVSKLRGIRGGLPMSVNHFTNKHLCLQLRAMGLFKTQRHEHSTKAKPSKSSTSLNKALTNLVIGKDNTKSLLCMKSGCRIKTDGSQRMMSSKRRRRKSKSKSRSRSKSKGGSCTYIMKPKDKKAKKDNKKISIEECCSYCDERVRKALDQLAAIVQCKAREIAEGTEKKHKKSKKSKKCRSRSRSRKSKSRSKSKKSKSRCRSKSKSKSKSRSKSKSKCKVKKKKSKSKAKKSKSAPCVTKSKVGKTIPGSLEKKKCKSDSSVGKKKSVMKCQKLDETLSVLKKKRSECKKKGKKDKKKKKKGAPKFVCKKNYTKDLCKKRPPKKKKSGKSLCKKKSSKKKSSKDICKKKSSKKLKKKKKSSKDLCKKKSSKSLKKKKSSKDICKKKSSKKMKKKSSKDICKKKSSKSLKKKKSSKNICKKKSSKSLKKKKSSKNICKKKSSKNLKKKSSKNLCKKKSSMKTKKKSLEELCKELKKQTSENPCKKKSSKKLKKKSSKDICKKKSSKSLKKKKSSKDICKKKSSKDLKKKKSSKSICKKKSSKNLKKKKSSKYICKKKSSKNLKKKKSSKDICKKKSSKNLKKKKSSKDICKKKSSKNLKKKKSSKSICKKKSSKNLKKKKSSKDICKKKSSKNLKKKKSSKDICKKKSSKNLAKKKSSKNVCKTKSSKSLKKKKSSKDICKKTSSKNLKKKKSLKSICKKKSSKNLKKKKSSKSICKKKSSKNIGKKKKKSKWSLCKTSSKKDSKKKKSKKSICKKDSKKLKKKKSKKSKSKVKCSKSSQSVSQNEYCVLKASKSATSAGKGGTKLPCNAKLKKCPSGGKVKAACEAQHKKDMKAKPSKDPQEFCKKHGVKDKKGKGKKKKKKKEKKKNDGMVCATPKKKKAKATFKTKCKDKKKKKKKNKKKLKKCKSSKSTKSTKVKCLDGTRQGLMVECPGMDSTGKAFMGTKPQRVSGDFTSPHQTTPLSQIELSKKPSEMETFIILNHKKLSGTNIKSDRVSKSSFAKNLDLESDKPSSTKSKIPKYVPQTMSITSEDGRSTVTYQKRDSTYTDSLDHGNEVLITSDGTNHKTRLSVPPDAEKIVLEIDLKNMNEGPIITKITATPNNKVEVEQKQVLDAETEQIRKSAMTNVSLKRPPRAVSEVKLYTLQSTYRRQVVGSDMQRELMRYVKTIKGQKPNTLVFQAKPVGENPKKKKGQNVEDVGNNVDFKPKKRDLHCHGKRTRVGPAMVDPPVKPYLKEVSEPAVDTYSCKEPTLTKVDMVDPNNQVAISDPLTNWYDPILCRDLRNKTFQDIFPPGKDQDGDGVFYADRCFGGQEAPTFGVCDCYQPMDKPTFGACKGPQSVDDYVHSKERDTFYSHLFGEPLPIDECSLKEFDYSIPTEYDLMMARKREHMMQMSRRLAEEEETRKACEKKMKDRCRTPMGKVDYSTIDFGELVQCSRNKEESRRMQLECFKAIAAHWNHLNTLRKRRQRKRLQKPTTYTTLPKRVATFMDPNQSTTLSPPGRELTPDYVDTSSAIATGHKERQQWRAKNLMTMSLVKAQKNPQIKVYRDETNRRLCNDFEKCLHKFKMVDAGHPGPFSCNPKRVCTCQDDDKSKEDKNKEGKKGSKKNFIGASVVPVIMCNYFGNETLSRHRIIFDADHDSGLPSAVLSSINDQQENYNYIEVDGNYWGGLIFKMADMIMPPVNYMISKMVPNVVGPHLESNTLKVKDGKPKDQQIPNEEQDTNKNQPEEKSSPETIKNEEMKKPSRESLVNMVAGYLARIFPTTSTPDQEKKQETGTTTREPEENSSQTPVIPENKPEDADIIARRLRNVLEHKQQEYNKLLASKNEDTQLSIHRVKKQLGETKDLLDDITATVQKLKEKIKVITDMTNAKQRGLKEALSSHLDELMKSQNALEAHYDDINRRLHNVHKRLALTRGEAWKDLQDVTKRSENLARIRRERNEDGKAKTKANMEVEWIKAITELRETVAKLYLNMDVSDLQIKQQVSEIRRLVHEKVTNKRVQESLKLLELTIAKESQQDQTKELRAKAQELKNQLKYLKELASKASGADLSKEREQTLKELKAAAEAKKEEIKELIKNFKDQGDDEGSQGTGKGKGNK
ncbi:uncharacterized protein [Atheta coriaria]|uniref:uncharacterized protein n=1 Tax=Dalotia coriaria TaxID=877792 RepID=UPI0031F39CA0